MSYMCRVLSTAVLAMTGNKIYEIPRHVKVPSVSKECVYEEQLYGC